ncbi:MAG: hypothetical protein IJM20_07610 [Clostridia bacterium]|jgi:hypothetical protein|nr:hypothetical protein [Clostridia bacterium]
MKRNAENNSSKRKAIRISLLVLSLLLLAGAVGVSAKYIMEKQVQGGTIPANTPGEENTPDLQVNPNPNDPLRTEAPSEKPTEEPTEDVTEEPTEGITEEPAETVTDEPTDEPTGEPEQGPGTNRE